MTARELQERQQWTLYQKIDHAAGAVESFISRTGKTPYVSFSGGKDSTVLLDLVRRFIDMNIKAVFCNTGNEYPEIIRFVKTFENVTIIRPELSIREVIEKYGFPLISKEQAQGIREAKYTKSEKLRNIRLYGTNVKKGKSSGKIAEKWKFLIYEPFDISERCCDVLKKRPFEKYNRITGEVPIIGTLAVESTLRKEQYIRRGGCNSFKENKEASYPLSIFTGKDIWEYKRLFKLNFCEIYDMRADRTGCVICGFGAHLEEECRFNLLYDLHPFTYNSLMNLTNNGVTYREALRKTGVCLPDECRQLKLNL